MKNASVLALSSLLVLAAACASSPTHEADEGLEGTLRARINEKHVHIEVHHGIVTLDGHVPTAADRRAIDGLVRSTQGVVALKDNLEVTLPSPGVYGAVPSSIPVYPTPAPELAPTGPVVMPPAVVLPDYPKLKVQAWSDADVPAANRIAAQLQVEALPAAGLENVTITVRNGNVSLQGTVDSHDERAALIEAIQRAGGVNAIYDQLHIP